ncbi:hypothetical protein DFH08DRAFT_801570 [Mycena albidolilacea]|uniref:Uncharacterized protein n=1 Tax=Mycena albidolilacea TaxID=1033008 RepID=A0AAD7AIV0_9AGAR|nr:hypothetical protein DFH08DRAFT_801570 [Mycena albidolilacea]
MRGKTRTTVKWVKAYEVAWATQCRGHDRRVLLEVREQLRRNNGGKRRRRLGNGSHGHPLWQQAGDWAICIGIDTSWVAQGTGQYSWILRLVTWERDWTTEQCGKQSAWSHQQAICCRWVDDSLVAAIERWHKITSPLHANGQQQEKETLRKTKTENVKDQSIIPSFYKKHMALKYRMQSFHVCTPDAQFTRKDPMPLIQAFANVELEKSWVSGAFTKGCLYFRPFYVAACIPGHPTQLPVFQASLVVLGILKYCLRKKRMTKCDHPVLTWSKSLGFRVALTSKIHEHECEGEAPTECYLCDGVGERWNRDTSSTIKKIVYGLE